MQYITKESKKVYPLILNCCPDKEDAVNKGTIGYWQHFSTKLEKFIQGYNFYVRNDFMNLK